MAADTGGIYVVWIGKYSLILIGWVSIIRVEGERVPICFLEPYCFHHVCIYGNLNM